MEDSRIIAMRGYDDISWGLLMFSKDPMKKKIPEENVRSIIEHALNAGYAAAEVWLSEHAGESFGEWIRSGKLKIVLNEKTQSPHYALLSIFEEKSERVTLFQDSISRVSAAASESVPELEESEDVSSLILAHEYFHYMEYHKMVGFGGYDMFAVKTIFGMKRTLKLIAYSEIAANAFAKKVCAVNFFPALLDVLLLSTFDKANIDKYELWFKANGFDN